MSGKNTGEHLKTPERAAETSETLESRLVASLETESGVNRRTVLGALGLAGSAALVGVAGGQSQHGTGADGENGTDDGMHFGAVGEYGEGFDPHAFLTTFNTGRDGQDSLTQRVYEENGTTVREFEFTAVDTTVEIAPGVEFPVWAYEGQVPGPTIRAVEGDRIRITFTNGSQHGHTIHPHLKNFTPAMDGIPQNGPGVLETGESFTYEWTAQPMGSHLYHCHALPLKEHIHRGLYGMIIVDPDPERVRANPREYVDYHGPMTDDFRDELVERAKRRNHEYPENDAVNEMVMVMNAFDTDFDGENEVYAVNTRAFAYGATRPIRIDRDQLQRIYLVNVTEFDFVNSLHTHSQFFDYYDHGTTLMPTHKTIDTVLQCQAQRGILEIDYSDHEPGLYMFHSHQSEFAELGWMSFFEVV